jgi:hypothetical protein
MELLARSTKGLYTGPDDEDAEIHDEDGHLNPEFDHLPGGTDAVPISFATPALERIDQLCPPRPGGKAHTPESRARSLFGSDALVITAAMIVVGWAIGGDGAGALERFGEQFRNGDQP